MICKDKDRCITHLRRCLQYVTDAGHISLANCDDVIRQYREFVATVSTSEAFLSFKVDSSRLDTLFHDSMSKKKEYDSLWQLVRRLLLLSHGQASVERGFSLNKEVMKENLSAHTLIALRSVKDHVMSIGGRPEDVIITPELLSSASAA